MDAANQTNNAIGPLLAKADKQEEASLDRIFGRDTIAYRAESKVTRRLREEEASVPFLSNCFHLPRA